MGASEIVGSDAWPFVLGIAVWPAELASQSLELSLECGMFGLDCVTLLFRLLAALLSLSAAPFGLSTAPLGRFICSQQHFAAGDRWSKPCQYPVCGVGSDWN